MYNILYDVIPSRSFYYLLLCHAIMWQCDHDSVVVWQFVMVTYDVILNETKSTLCNSDNGTGYELRIY